MVDPVMVSSNNKPIFFIDLSGQNSIPMIPDSFISNHLKGNTQSTKLKLTSDVSDRSWEVELDDGQRFARGWKYFSVHHGVRNDDVLSFRHDGDMVFHVTPFGHSTSEEELSPNKTSSKKRAITETESSSENSYLVAHVTSSNLSRNHMGLTNKFARSNGLNNRQCEIDLLNEDGKSWTLDLRHNKTTGQTYMCRGWTGFCQGNGIKAGSSCRFRFVQSGTKPVLQLCPNNTSTVLHVPETKGDEIESEDGSEAAQMKQNRSVEIEFKPHMLRTGQLRLPALFSRENEINEAGEVTIVNRDGVEWKLHLVRVKGRGQFYIKGFKDCFVANGIKKVGDSFTLDIIRGGTNPILKICSKIKEASLDGNQTTRRREPNMIQAPRAEEEMETRVQKKARVSSAEGGSSRRTRVSNKLSAGPADLQRKKPLEPCSISDQVSKVRQSVVHALTDGKRFWESANSSTLITSRAEDIKIRIWDNGIVPDAFLATHLEEGKNESTTLTLTSDACDRTWRVKLNGRKFADGWEDFSAAHCLRDDDVLVFRDDGHMIFHVTPSGRRFFQIHYISSSSDDDDGYDETWDKVSDLRTRLKTESSSSKSSCVLGVTSSNLRLNRVSLAKSFRIANGLHKTWCEIDVMNQSGKSWVMGLRHNKGTSQDFIRGGWTSFCRENELKTGSFYRFELVRTGTRPALKLCSDINTPQRNCSKAKVSAKPSKFMKVTLKPYMLKVKKTCEFSTSLESSKLFCEGERDQERRNGNSGGQKWRNVAVPCSFCKCTWRGLSGNRAKTMVKTETRFQKKAKVSAQGGPSRRTQASHKSTVDPESLQRKQPLETVTHRVRQSIVNVLADVRRFRSELEIEEQKLEAVLEEIDVLGEKVSEINKFFK
ncbi:hypothetical protein Bca52824_094922 [Brassica carinata]|uniref:TF-B3 domain-containing protein n=1 Tax=Brassica carinata TaxID=52824 RepID=A0A8X7TIQ8_BRACI|nr:hypothetical protein Bca52824_094922 [Brassica carinata]